MGGAGADGYERSEGAAVIKMIYIILTLVSGILLSGVAATVFLQIDQIMIGNMIDKTSVGYFSVASKFVELKYTDNENRMM